VSALVPDPERPGEEDMASRREEEFRALALRQQQQRASCRRASQPGVCTNCGNACLPTAVYCDADCRDDHERRLALPR